MQKKIFLSAVLLFLSIMSATAGVQHCRSGVVVAAEVTKGEVKIAELPPLAFQNLPQEKAYAVVSLKLDDMRELSIFDYSLEIKGASFPCVALYRNNRYEYYLGNIIDKGVQQMVFIVDSKLIPDSGKVTAALKSNLSEVRFIYDVNIPLSVIGKSTPKAPRAIPASGLIFR